MVRRRAPRPTNFAEAKTTDERAYAAFFHAMLREGVALPPGAYEALFVGMAHTDDVLDEIGAAAGRARPPRRRRLADRLTRRRPPRELRDER